MTPQRFFQKLIANKNLKPLKTWSFKPISPNLGEPQSPFFDYISPPIVPMPRKP